jgi:hypothetical protein
MELHKLNNIEYIQNYLLGGHADFVLSDIIKDIHLNYTITKDKKDDTIYYVRFKSHSSEYIGFIKTKEVKVNQDVYNNKSSDSDDQMRELDKVVDKIKLETTDNDDRARIAISMVQTIPYIEGIRNESAKKPYRVLYSNSGDCDEKTLLLEYILYKLGYDVVTFETYITQFEYVGGSWQVQFDYPLTINTQQLFEWDNQFHIIDDTNGDVYTIQNTPPYTLTLVGNTMFNTYFYRQAAQRPDCVRLEFYNS